MLRYVVRRLFQAIPVLIVVAIVVFSLVHMIPGDPAQMILGDQASSEQLSELRTNMGLDKPIIVQFGIWISGVLRGDLGYSYSMSEPVASLILSHMEPTGLIALITLVISAAIAIPIGVVAASRRNSAVDRLLSIGTLVGISVPGFLTALFLVLIFAVGLKILPAGGWVEPQENFLGFISAIILPVISLSGLQLALLARMTRSSMIDQLHGTYIKTARAKGLSENVIIWKHALRNSFVPILNVLGQSFGSLIAGTVVIETVFNIPGIGQLIINSVLRRDYLVIQAIVLTIAVVYIFINLLVDIFSGELDPRIRTKG